MAVCPGMNLTMDLTRYFSLPSDLRVRFDAWLRAEHLIERKVIQLTLGEGVVTIERYAVDENNKIVCGGDDKALRTVETIAVLTRPPEDAMRWSPEL